MSNTNCPIKVAIVGGGCSGVATAFELTRPELGGRYEVTLYQQGFRLGGKGASGRGRADRIEEHGLHLWMGFYENAFRLMRECYAELGRDPATCHIADWQDAFKPDHFCGAMDRSPANGWVPWTVYFPAMPGLPGDPGARAWTVGEYLSRSVSLVLTLLRAIRSNVGEPAPASSAERSNGAAQDFGPESVLRWLRYGELATLTGLLQAIELLDLVVRNLPAYPRDLILRFHALIANAVQAQLRARTQGDDESRRLWEIVDLTLSAIRGIIRFGSFADARGFDACDDYDCREWLRLNGAAQQSVDSAFVRALYDLAFAYEDGDVNRPRIAAGQALRGALRAFFTYRGAFFWKMQAGMGDIVFAPFYEVLLRRGVRFEFFHRLKHIAVAPTSELSAEGTAHVSALEFDVQASLLNAPYRPMKDVRGLPCWSAEPDFEQLVDGARLREAGWTFESHWERRSVGTKTLTVSEDFDFVVLAVGLGELPYVCSELREHSERWRTMLSSCKSVATQAFQLWTNVDMAALGWTGEAANISGFVEPFDTWADMRQLIHEESFEPAAKGVAYFCSVLPDTQAADFEHPAYPAARRDEVRLNAIQFLDQHVCKLWPLANRAPGQFRWEVLQSPNGAPPSVADSSRFLEQFWTANTNPSDRYSLSLPGTLKYRISPLDRSFDNLTIAGDYTDCGFNEGCVEAAVMSGRLAAHALSGSPKLEDIVGYDHP